MGLLWVSFEELWQVLKISWSSFGAALKSFGEVNTDYEELPVRFVFLTNKISSYESVLVRIRSRTSWVGPKRGKRGVAYIAPKGSDLQAPREHQRASESIGSHQRIPESHREHQRAPKSIGSPQKALQSPKQLSQHCHSRRATCTIRASGEHVLGFAVLGKAMLCCV